MGHLEQLKQQLPPFTHHELASGGTAPQLLKPDIVIYPGTSTRRQLCLQYAFPDAQHSTVPIGEEPQVNIGDTMMFKLNEALPHLSTYLPDGGQCVVVVAADQQNVTPRFDTNSNSIQLTSHQKPKTTATMIQRFRNMAEFSQLTSQSPFYYGDAASGVIHHRKGQIALVEDRRKSLVDLRPEQVEMLATEEGFQHYIAALTDFYSGPPYSNNNIHMDFTHLSAGLSLEVLVKMGIVNSIDGVNTEDKGFREQLKNAIANVAVGISPALLSSLQIDAEEVLGNWKWLNGVADKALSG